MYNHGVKTLSLLLLVPFHFFQEVSCQDPYAIYNGKYLVKLEACDEKAIEVIKKALKKTDCSFLSEEGTMQLPAKGCGVEYVICSPEAAKMLEAKDGARITNKDAGVLFRKMGGTTHGWDTKGVHAANEFYSNYRNLAAIEAKVKELVDGSGGIATLEELLPKTHEGRTIKAVRFRGSGWQSGRPRVVLSFQQHAREWVAGMTGVYTVEYLIKKVKENPSALAGMEVVMTPMSNPDGFAYSSTRSRFWRKNRRDNPRTNCDGVDLNRNWDTAWGERQSTSTNPCSDVFIGPGARSEPESQALGKLIEEAPVLVHLDIHCFSEVILGPWGYKSSRHAEKPKVDELGNAMLRAIKEVHGKNYRYGTGGQLLYLASGVFPDWSTSKGAYGYTYELRPAGGGIRGFAPPPSQILPSAEEAFNGIWTAIDWAKKKGTPVAPTPTPTPRTTPRPPPTPTPSPRPTPAPTPSPGGEFGPIVPQPPEGCPKPTTKWGQTTCCCGYACCWDRCIRDNPPIQDCLIGAAAKAEWKKHPSKGYWVVVGKSAPVTPAPTPAPTPAAPARRRRRQGGRRRRRRSSSRRRSTRRRRRSSRRRRSTES
mmetsp:Transcript_41909/g.77939  ORF Transcript_41909/g.77939 Transcript_41909/m.77939 type:complete len:593 (-) Transcript_41909:33-1811(-)